MGILLLTTEYEVSLRSVMLEDSRSNTRKKSIHSKLVAFNKVSRRRPLSCSLLNYDEKGEGRCGGAGCSFVLWLLQQEEEYNLRQDLLSCL